MGYFFRPIHLNNQALPILYVSKADMEDNIKRLIIVKKEKE